MNMEMECDKRVRSGHYNVCRGVKKCERENEDVLKDEELMKKHVQDCPIKMSNGKKSIRN